MVFASTDNTFAPIANNNKNVILQDFKILILNLFSYTIYVNIFHFNLILYAYGDF